MFLIKQDQRKFTLISICAKQMAFLKFPIKDYSKFTEALIMFTFEE